MSKLKLTTLGILIAAVSATAWARPVAADETWFNPRTGQVLYVDHAYSEEVEPEEPTEAEEFVGVDEFSREADYKSLAGYYRQVVFQNTGIWLNLETATESLDY